jgi:L-lactate dehydrogenase complex protein LldG
MSDARTAILGRLRAARPAPLPVLPDWSVSVPPAERLDRFCERLEASHAEVVTSTSERWPTLLAERLQARSNVQGSAGVVASVLYAPDTQHGRHLADAWADQPDLRLLPYDQPVETLKDTLVHGVDAAVTATRGGIAETGTLILWPSAEEPRLMSLLPPLHVALVEAKQIYGTLTEAMTAQNWSAGLPTNALLISGPSKTADIEQTLAYGVHGPKELLVIMLDP